MTAIQRIVDDNRFHRFIISVILVNAAILGLLTFDISPSLRNLLEVIDNVCLVIFCAEIIMKLVALGPRFFRDGWNVFDFVVVGIALLPATGPLAVLRTLRVLRLLRLVTAVPSMKRVVNGMFVALPGGASVAAVLLILYYVAAIIADSLFREGMPQYFGDMGTTFFTLFQLMTIEGWNGIAIEVMEVYPRSWIFFVTFIIFTAFTTLNLLFGIIVDAMETAKEEEVRQEMAEQGVAVDDSSSQLRIALIEEEVRAIRRILEEDRASRSG
ncbi:MAG TPA: ion transporter [Paracoccaceae bacterium]|nr:ion transporter [Paracoccaceae bacterium]